MTPKALSALGVIAVVLGYLMNVYSLAADTPASQPTSQPGLVEGYLIWTQIEEPDTGAAGSLFAPHHIFVYGRFRCGQVHIQVERYSEGPFVGDAAADTERIVMKMAEQIVGGAKLDSPESLLPKVGDLGAEWYWPWECPTKWGNPTEEKIWRAENLKDPRGIMVMAASMMESLTEKDWKESQKKSQDQLDAATKDPNQGRVFGITTGGDMLRILEVLTPASLKDAISSQRALGIASGWAANEYDRSRANGRKDASDRPGYEEHDDDRLTINVFVFHDEAPLDDTEEMVKKAVELTKKFKEIGLKEQREVDLKAMEDLKKQRDDFAAELEQLKKDGQQPSKDALNSLAEADKRLAIEKKKQDVPTTFEVDYKWFNQETDDYWKWLVDFNDLAEKNNREINTIVTALALKADDSKVLLQKWQSLMQTENEAWPSEDEESLLNRFLPAGIPHIWDRDPSSLPSLSPKLSLAKMKAARDDIAKQIADLHAEQAACMTEAEGLIQAIVTHVQGEWDRSSRLPSEDLKQDLQNTLSYWKAQQAFLKVRLYDAAQWYGEKEMPALIESLGLTAKADPEIVLVMQAKVLLARAEDLERRVWLQRSSLAYSPTAKSDPTATEARSARMVAITLLNQVLKQFPKNQEVRSMLLQQEFIVLNWISGKLEHEKQTSLAAFEKFLTNRGYNANDSTGWWEGFKETGWVIWAHPWSTGGHWIAGTAQGLADATISDQEKIAANHVSLMLIKRLSRRGLLLKEIRALPIEGLRANLILVQGDQKTPMPDDKVDRLRTDMFGTFNELYDLSALSEGKGDKFLEYFNKTYYDVFDPERTWTEALGNFFLSPSMLVCTVGPSSRLIYGGKDGWKIWRFTGAEITALSAEGKAINMGEFMYKAANLDSLSKRMSKSWLSAAVADDMKFIRDLNLVQWVARVGTRAAASIVLYSASVQAADEYNIPGLRALATCIFELGAQQLTYDLLAKSGLYNAKVVERMNRFCTDLAKQSEELAARGRMLNEMESLATRFRSAVKAEEKQTISIAMEKSGLVGEGTGTIKTVVARGLDTPADYLFALRALAKEVAKKDKNGPEIERITKALNAFWQKMTANLKELTEQSRIALAILRKEQPLNRPYPNLTFKKMNQEVPAEFIQAADVYSGAAGELLREGDILVLNGKFDAALRAYTKAARRADLHGEADLAKLLDDRRAFTAMAQAEFIEQGAIGKTAKEDILALVKPISDGERSAVQTFTKASAARGDRYFIATTSDGKMFFFKRYNRETAEQIAENNMTECVVSVLGRGVDLPVAAVKPATMRSVRDAAGNEITKADGLLNRFVDGADATECTLAELVAHKREFAELRAFRAWIGDPDGHLGNFRIGKDSVVSGIDFGNAQLTSSGEHKLIRGMVETDPDKFMDLMLDHINWQAGRAPDHTAYAGASRLDEFLRYEDMKNVIGRIKELCGKEGELEKLITEGLDSQGTVFPAMVKDIAATLRERANILDRHLKEKFPKVDIPKAEPPSTSRLGTPKEARDLCRRPWPVRLAA